MVVGGVRLKQDRTLLTTVRARKWVCQGSYWSLHFCECQKNSEIKSSQTVNCIAMCPAERRVFKIKEGSLCTILLTPTRRSDFCVGACVIWGYWEGSGFCWGAWNSMVRSSLHDFGLPPPPAPPLPQSKHSSKEWCIKLSVLS